MKIPGAPKSSIRTTWHNAYLAIAIVAAVATAVPSNSSAADAQTAPSTVVGLEEIVVTSQKRSENLQNVPMSITAISAATLESANIQTFADYAAKVPNLTFSNGQAFGAVNSRGIAIRGIQGGDTTGFYINDLPVPISLEPRVVDISRIEVLRGPQGTLYGARSMGGTVRLITPDPNLQGFSANAHAQAMAIESGGNGYQLDGTFNIPILTDRLAARITPYSGTDGGFENRAFPNPTNPAALTEIKNGGRDNYYGVTAALLWKPIEGLTVRSMIMHQLSSTNGLPLGDYSPQNRLALRHFDIAEENRDVWTNMGVVINYQTPVGDISSATSMFDRTAHESEDATEFTQAVYSGALGFTLPFFPAPINAVERSHSIIEELRFASNFKGPIQFIGGLYFSNETTTFINDETPIGFDALTGNLLGTDTVFYGFTHTLEKDRAAFGELTYTFSPQWSVTLGGRYSKSELDTSGYEFGSAVGPDLVNSIGSESEHGFTPKFLVKYQASDNLNLYALASKGFRTGNSQTPPPVSFCAANYAAYNLTPDQLQSYKGDSLWNYEVGVKTRFPDQRITVNAAAFWIDWTNTRQRLVFPCGYDATINSGKARSRGGELEVTAVPFEGLSINAGVGYADAKVITPGPLISVPPAGSQLQQVAPWTANFSADYRYPLTAELKSVARIDYSYTDHSFSANIDPLNPRLRPSYEIVNLRLGLQRGPWEAALFVANLANTRPNLGDQSPLAVEDPGRPRWQTSAPRTYGLDFRTHF